MNPIDKVQSDQYINYSFGEHELRDGSKHSTTTWEERRESFRKDFDQAIVKGTFQGAVPMAAPHVAGFKTIVGMTGVFDVVGQAVNSHGFTTDDYRPAQTLFAMATAAGTAKLTAFATSTPYYSLNMLNAGLISGDVAMANTAFTNYYYGENKDLITSFKLGFGFGTAGYVAGSQTTDLLSRSYLRPTFNPAVPALNQNYITPRANYLGNVVVGTSVSSTSSLFDIPDSK